MKPPLSHVLELIRSVIEDGRNAVHDLRVGHVVSLNLEEAFSRIKQELGIPEEVAAIAVYLGSDESSFTTGHIHLVDGGMAL